MTKTANTPNDYARGLVQYHGTDEASQIARLMLGTAYRLHVETYHTGVFGDPDYYASAFDFTVNEGHWDHMMLMLASMVERLQPLYAGDRIRLTVTRYGREGVSEVLHTFDDVVQRADARLVEIAHSLEP